MMTGQVAGEDAGALNLGGTAAARAIRYTAIVGAIDRYLDDVVSRIKIDESVSAGLEWRFRAAECLERL